MSSEGGENGGSRVGYGQLTASHGAHALTFLDQATAREASRVVGGERERLTRVTGSQRLLHRPHQR